MTSTFERHESLECGPAAPEQDKTGARRHEPQPTLCPGYQA